MFVSPGKLIKVMQRFKGKHESRSRAVAASAARIADMRNDFQKRRLGNYTALLEGERETESG